MTPIFNRLHVIATAFLAIAAFIASPQAASAAAGTTAATAAGKAKPPTRFALQVTDRKGKVRVVTIHDRSGRTQSLRKNSLMNCINLQRATAAFVATRIPYFALRAGALAQGCGTWIADQICWTSRQWYGGGARWIVSMVTQGHYSRC
jgi:hypothetical protein